MDCTVQSVRFYWTEGWAAYAVIVGFPLITKYAEDLRSGLDSNDPLCPRSNQKRLDATGKFKSPP